MRWAKRWNWDEPEDPQVLELTNNPFSVKIVKLEQRTEGGRAYKVIDSENRLFDLREDQVIETIATHGIKPGGEIPGFFVWAIIGSQVKMVIIGGKTYKELVPDTVTGKPAPAAYTSSKLKVGKVYKQRSGLCCAYVGKVKTPVSKGKWQHMLVDIGYEDRETS